MDKPRKRLKPSYGTVDNPTCPYCQEIIQPPPMEYCLGGRCGKCGEWCAVALIDGLWTWVKYPLDLDIYTAMWEDDE